MSQQRWAGPYSQMWYEDAYDSYPGVPNVTYTNHAHSSILDRALYAHWFGETEKGYQYLADAYNNYVRKPGEACLLPPPQNL